MAGAIEGALEESTCEAAWATSGADAGGLCAAGVVGAGAAVLEGAGAVGAGGSGAR